MPTKIRAVQTPRGVARALYRLPIRLIHLHLGWLLMGHFLLLTHIGRKSGQQRQTVQEVLLHDRAQGVYYVMAGWGERSDWVKNIEKTPRWRSAWDAAVSVRWPGACLLRRPSRRSWRTLGSTLTGSATSHVCWAIALMKRRRTCVPWLVWESW
jgi:F420H(2)-dependent quinone reductase